MTSQSRSRASRKSGGFMKSGDIESDDLDFSTKINVETGRKNATDCRAKHLHLIDIPVVMIGFMGTERTQKAIEFLDGCVDLTIVEGVNGRDMKEVLNVANVHRSALLDPRVGCTLAHLRVSTADRNRHSLRLAAWHCIQSPTPGHCPP